MSGLSAFLAQNALKTEIEKHVISDRFVDDKGNPIPWEIRALTEAENKALRNACTKKIKDKGIVTTNTDYDEYLAKLIVESVVFPNLKDKELQESYGVVGAENLVRTMLTSGEYAKLLEVVQEVNGFDVGMEELVEEAKN
ncbi:phage tail assembly chaperone [Tepidimicrobium xylanilyticum]|uniref:Phage XkdN-like tail assembly chaperone protein, TAC n=1 Tax=Tepidimicrobium xylanilyticum TaxID=1123352 RepID=A0A1H3EYE5_9FIRM|nr:phage portal protein [Tepidimicrobium xylanilyticum]SDX83098.1 Phage XkdN-like tail assembly chaperone protein, TAC [Tepidimicrobium xylanilyticum]